MKWICPRNEVETEVTQSQATQRWVLALQWHSLLRMVHNSVIYTIATKQQNSSAHNTHTHTYIRCVVASCYMADVSGQESWPLPFWLGIYSEHFPRKPRQRVLNESLVRWIICQATFSTCHTYNYVRREETVAAARRRKTGCTQWLKIIKAVGSVGGWPEQLSVMCDECVCDACVCVYCGRQHVWPTLATDQNGRGDTAAAAAQHHRDANETVLIFDRILLLATGPLLGFSWFQHIGKWYVTLAKVYQLQMHLSHARAFEECRQTKTKKRTAECNMTKCKNGPNHCVVLVCHAPHLSLAPNCDCHVILSLRWLFVCIASFSVCLCVYVAVSSLILSPCRHWATSIDRRLPPVHASYAMFRHVHRNMAG